MTAVKTASKTTATAAAPFAIRNERARDVAAREALLDTCFGDGRHARTCQRLRDGRHPAEGLAFSALSEGRLVGTVRLWHISAAGRAALVLGPLAVDPSCRDLGIGAALMHHAIEKARQLGHPAIILLGDAPYYERFGFSAEKAAELHLAGPFERNRLLARELREGALAGARGMILATGLPIARGKRARSDRREGDRTQAA